MAKPPSPAASSVRLGFSSKTSRFGAAIASPWSNNGSPMVRIRSTLIPPNQLDAPRSTVALLQQNRPIADIVSSIDTFAIGPWTWSRRMGALFMADVRVERRLAAILAGDVVG